MELLVDAHCHLDHEAFKDDLDKVLERAKEAGVSVVIAQGVNDESNRKVIELSKRYKMIKAALGLYPLDAVNVECEQEEGEPPLPRSDTGVGETLGFIEKSKDDIVAIGEVGIDLKYSKDLKTQTENFEKIIALAKRIDKPLIVHSRNAEKEVLGILENNSARKVLMHCFGGSMKLVKLAVDLGYYLSIPTNVVRSSHFQKIVEMVPLSHLLLETDAPYLSPEPGKRNEPANIRLSLKKVAEIKGIDEGEAEKALFMNYQRLFQ